MHHVYFCSPAPASFLPHERVLTFLAANTAAGNSRRRLFLTTHDQKKQKNTKQKNIFVSGIFCRPLETKRVAVHAPTLLWLSFFLIAQGSSATWQQTGHTYQRCVKKKQNDT
jgi:hypothetical protein